ncbi:MAG TPA: FAD-binding oxidoreductase [Phycisphaerales bacterium]|nr:FAD-binding oxidoreductase [Phycisphaerales bacterium]
MPHLPVLNNPSTPLDAESARIAADLGAAIGDGVDIRFSRHDRGLYSTDASLYQVEPLGVVVPHSIGDAVRVVGHCAAGRIPMLARGGGTSLAGGCGNGAGGGCLRGARRGGRGGGAGGIDFTARCRAIRSVDVAGRTCEVEAGIGIDELNEHLAGTGTGLFFAPDPATTRQCAIGGAIGNNAAGARSVLYGRTSENIRRVEVALASGERLWLGPNAGAGNPTARRLAEGVIGIVTANARRIRERFPRTIRRNAGYGLDMMLDQVEAGATSETLDLAKLLCGSEGTLAVTLGATLMLHPVPRAKGLALVAFESVDAAIEAVRPILATKPSAVELLDDVVLDAARGNEGCRPLLAIMPRVGDAEPVAILYVEYFAFESAEELRGRFGALRGVVGGTSGEMIREYTDGPSMAKAWALRKAGEPLLHGMPGPRKPITFVEDNAVPVERLGEFVREFRGIVARHGTRAAYWAHASVGVLHVRPMIDIHDPADRERLRAIAVEVADLARRCGGVMSGGHGGGRGRGLVGRFFPGVGPKYARGRPPPTPGDLAFTEFVVFGS